MKISRERKMYGMVLGAAVLALCADRMLFAVPLSGPAESRGATQIEESTSSSSPKPVISPPSLKRRIESFRDLSPVSSENAFASRVGAEHEIVRVVEDDTPESPRQADVAFTLRAVGGVGTDRAFARVNDVLLRPGETDEHGMTLVSLEKRKYETGEVFHATIRTPEGREVALRMAIGDID